MAKFIYTVYSPTIAHPTRKEDCKAMHYSSNQVFIPLPDSITEPDDAKEYIESKVLPTHSGDSVSLFLQCEKWVPATHIRKPRR